MVTDHHRGGRRRPMRDRLRSCRSRRRPSRTPQRRHRWRGCLVSSARRRRRCRRRPPPWLSILIFKAPSLPIGEGQYFLKQRYGGIGLSGCARTRNEPVIGGACGGGGGLYAHQRMRAGIFLLAEGEDEQSVMGGGRFIDTLGQLGSKSSK